MALMTTSGSIPFSLASASMVCCRGFDIVNSGDVCPPVSKFHFQMGPRNHSERNPMPPTIVALDQDVVAVHAREHPLEERLALDSLTHDQLCAAARESPIVVGMTEGQIEPG